MFLMFEHLFGIVENVQPFVMLLCLGIGTLMRQLLTTSVLSLSIELYYSVESFVQEKIKNYSSDFQRPFSKYVHIDRQSVLWESCLD